MRRYSSSEHLGRWQGWRAARRALRSALSASSTSSHIALLELDLPDMSVYRLAQVMRRHARADLCRLNLVAVAEQDAHASGDLARAAGFDGYLAKPIRSLELEHRCGVCGVKHF